MTKDAGRYGIQFAHMARVDIGTIQMGTKDRALNVSDGGRLGLGVNAGRCTARLMDKRGLQQLHTTGSTPGVYTSREGDKLRDV